MDKAKLFDMLDKAGDFIEALAPLAIAIGGPTVGKVIDVVEAVDDVVENITALAKEGKAVLQSNDVDAIDAALSRIRHANDALNAAIQAS